MLKLARPEAQLPRSGEVELPRENIYGHFARLEWLRDHLDRRSDHAVELGCGTGYMLTLPLRVWGYDVVGLDLDEESVAYGRQLMRKAGLSEDLVRCEDIADYEGPVTVVIASEVLEHMSDVVLDDVLRTVRAKLGRGGKMLVTIPNGYGWFELESALWFKLGLGRIIELLRLDAIIRLVKRPMTGDYRDASHPSTLADSPHVQRFTLAGIRRRLEQAGFEVMEARGSALVCGPFSNLLFTGFRRVMALNVALGRRWPALASDFQLVAVPRR
jgi:2-polyprenyl-3-methyl-5-hydroxy-6-metoxy-1,4-benzoquinol methylase